MKNIKKALSGLITFFLLSMTTTTVLAYTDTADIVSTKEIYKIVQVQKPYQYCYQTEVRNNDGYDGSATNELVGGILGGVIGNQFGKGSGRDVATIAGVLLGASVASDNEKAEYRKNNPNAIKTREVCKTRYRYEDQERFSHYLVSYNYKGVDYSYHSGYKPKGDKVSVKVSVSVIP